MKIGIISDTHIHKHEEKIVEIINKYLGDADMIVHAGDYTDRKVVNLLKRYKNFVGVWGNVDKDPVRELLNEKEIINVLGYRIGIFHGHGEKKTTIERAYDAFENEGVDIIIFGHSHQPTIVTKNRVLMLNPGSINYKRTGRWLSYIILNLDKDCIDAEIKFFNK